MSKHQRHRLMRRLSVPTDDDRSVTQQLREDPVAIHVTEEPPLPETYVTVPAITETVIETFSMLTRDGDDWKQTTIDPLALALLLQERAYSLEHESQTPVAHDDD